MTVYTKIGAHNRSTGAMTDNRKRKVRRFPQGVGYIVPMPRDLLMSPAWLSMSSQCRKFIDALMVEYADHGGLENGNLKAPYDMLQARGMRRETILDVVTEAKALGIVDPTRGQRSYGSRKSPSVYRLTWLATSEGLAPTNEWKAIKTDVEAEARMTSARHGLERERVASRARRAEYAARRAAGRAA